MASPPLAPDADMAALAQRAAVLEARGAWAEAIGAWSSAVARDPSFLPAQLGLAQAQIRAGRPADALPILEHVTARAPGVAGAWLALGVAQSMLERHGSAIASAERAVSIAPQVAALHTGLGDVLRQSGRLADSAAAYRQAVALAPDDPDALNKLAVIERAERRLDEAEALLNRAYARAPRHPYVRVNLGTLHLERHRESEGRAMLGAALASGSLPPDARDEAADALAMLDEHAALASAIDAAVAAGDQAPIAAALRVRPVPTRRDDDLLALLDRAARDLADAPTVDTTFARGPVRSAAWPALEAHHSFRLPGTPEALEHSVGIVDGRVALASDDDRDVARYAAAVATRDRGPTDPRDPVEWEAWLRFRHAQLVGHRPDLAPGQLKLINNMVTNQPQVPRTLPGAVAGTLRTWFGERAAHVPPGPWRAAFLMLLMSGGPSVPGRQRARTALPRQHRARRCGLRSLPASRQPRRCALAAAQRRAPDRRDATDRRLARRRKPLRRGARPRLDDALTARAATPR